MIPGNILRTVNNKMEWQIDIAAVEPKFGLFSSKLLFSNEFGALDIHFQCYPIWDDVSLTVKLGWPKVIIM
jgi:hypothetical protein